MLLSIAFGHWLAPLWVPSVLLGSALCLMAPVTVEAAAADDLVNQLN